MWQRMLLGPQTFFMLAGQLAIAFTPVLPAWLFDEQGELAFRFLSACEVRYLNPERRDTFGKNGARVTHLSCLYGDGTRVDVPGQQLHGQTAHDLRSGRIRSITAVMG